MKEQRKEKIAVLVSGGVDSSVALALLKEQGFEVTAFYLKIWLEDELSFLGECPWEEDLEYVRGVTKKLGVPSEIVSFQKEYWERVVSYTIDEVKKGRTPNPDMLCNTRIKFGAFYEYIGKNFDAVATGHYARTEEKNGHVYLKKTPDAIKDQTYFLSQLSKTQLSKALFPIGEYEKEEVRALAKKFALPNAMRKDSQGICFLGKIPFDAFLKHHLGEKKGKLIEFETGKVLGEHPGFWYFTVGQRQGIGLSGGPWYVVKKEPETNTIFISHAEHKAEQARDRFAVSDLNWFNEKPEDGMELSVKLRHGPKEYQCTVQWQNEEVLEVFLKEKDSGLAPGQFAVFYHGEYCLGGGSIL
ncbi:MAG: tRNA 2-thiouridine(34) synthase MnmA [Candidatus Moraniibacteriota bacterium]